MIAQKVLVKEMSKFVRIDSLQGLLLFLFDVLLYSCLIAGVLFFPDLWMKIVASILAGMKISNLVTLGHDAAHNSLTGSKRLNYVIAVVAFMPGLINYRLWSYIHHKQHHPMTNLVFPEDVPVDNFTPLSLEEFSRLTKFGQIKEKFYRMPTLAGFGIYFICERWFAMMLFPRNHMPGKIHRSAWKHFSLIVLYAGFFAMFLVNAPIYSNCSAGTALVLGLFLPFFIFQALLGFTVYVQHTHEKIAWFRERDSLISRENRRQELVSVQLTFPAWLAPLMQMHHAYDHAAHHVCPAIPCYQLGRAQERLNELLGDAAISQKFSFKWLYVTMKKCKLYDYERHHWTDFEGNRTSDLTLVNTVIGYALSA